MAERGKRPPRSIRHILDPHMYDRAEDGPEKRREALRAWRAALAHSVAGRHLGFPSAWLTGNQQGAIIQGAEQAYNALIAALDHRAAHNSDLPRPPNFFRDLAMLHQYMGQEGFNARPLASYVPNAGRLINGIMQIGAPTFHQTIIGQSWPNDLVSLTNDMLQRLPPDYFNYLPQGHPLRGHREVNAENIWLVYNSLPVQMAAAYLTVQPALARIAQLPGLNDQQRRTLAYIYHNVPEIGERMIHNIRTGNLTGSIAGTTAAEQRRFREIFLPNNQSVYGEGRSQETMTFLNQYAPVLASRGHLGSGQRGPDLRPDIARFADPVERAHLEQLWRRVLTIPTPPN
jgi:hypothetical protein